MFFTDESCGACGRACGAGTSCINGICDRRLRTSPSANTQCVRTDAALACWGRDDYGELGIGAAVSGAQLPLTVTVLSETETALFAVSADESTCAVAASGELRCFGRNDHGGLGQGVESGGPDDAAIADCCYVADATVPLLPEGTAVVDVAGGGPPGAEEFYCALATNGDVHCWGNGANKPVKKLENTVQLEAGASQACALTSNGQVWCWTSPIVVGNPVALGTPYLVEGLPPIRSIGVALEVVYAMAADGTVWAWGLAEYGQLGPEIETSHRYYYPPVLFSHSFEAPVVQVTGTNDSACALLENGDVLCWGKDGMQGDGTPSSPGYDPVPKRALTDHIVEIAACHDEMVARREDGQILRWGRSALTPTPMSLP